MDNDQSEGRMRTIYIFTVVKMRYIFTDNYNGCYSLTAIYVDLLEDVYQ